MGEVVAAQTIVQVISRYSGPTPHHLVAVKADGTLYTSHGGSATFGSLKKDGYTTIEVYIDVSLDKYYVWIDGVNKTPEGFKFLTDTDKANLESSMDFLLESYRLCHITNPTTLAANATLYLDNIYAYAERPVMGDGFFEHGGYVYYRQGATLLKNGIYTLGESTFKFDAEGRLLKTIRTPIGAFKSETTDELGVGVDTLKLVDEFQYQGSYPKRVTMTPNSALDTDGNVGVTFGDLGAYNNLNIEFNAYTDKIYENSAFGFFIFCNYANASGSNVNAYFSTWITLGTEKLTGYLAEGVTNTITSAGYGEPRSIDG